jgi:hypothetical protein
VIGSGAIGADIPNAPAGATDPTSAITEKFVPMPGTRGRQQLRSCG